MNINAGKSTLETSLY